MRVCMCAHESSHMPFAFGAVCVFFPFTVRAAAREPRFTALRRVCIFGIYAGGGQGSLIISRRF